MTAPIVRSIALPGRLAMLIVSFILAACTPIIAGYSLQAYTNATRLKAETLALVDISAEPWAEHAIEARALQTRLDAAYEFSAGTPYNREASAMWAILRDRAATALTGGFFARWQAQGTTGQAYRKFKRRFVAAAFDRLICLEANKKQKISCPPLDGVAAGDAEAGNE